jgi:toxin ParE1/3/4
MKVYWTDEALIHLDNIYRHIAEDAPVYARRMVDKITRRSQQIGVFSQSGRMVPEYQDIDIREIIEPPYRIVYHITPDRLDVLAVFHGAQLLPDDPNA